MKMKLFSLFFIGFLSLSYQASAQQKLTEEQRTALMERVKEDAASLNLTEEQKEPYKEISVKYARKLQALKDSDEPRRDKHQKLQNITKEKNKEMKALLSKEQYETYLEIQKRRKQEMKEHRKR